MWTPIPEPWEGAGQRAAVPTGGTLSSPHLTAQRDCAKCPGLSSPAFLLPVPTA